MRTLRAEVAERLGGGVEGPGADLLRIVEDAAQVRTLAEVEADQVAEQVGVGLRQVGPVLLDEQRRDALLDLGLRDLDAVGVRDLQPPREDVAQQAERLVLGARVGAAVEAVVPLGRVSAQSVNS